jgi:hypothetical protein
MIAEITSALQGTKIVSDLFEKFRKSKAPREATSLDEISAAIDEQKIKLVTAVDLAMASQEKQLALAQEVAALKEENKQLKDWDREKERYTRTDIAPGIPAYVLKPHIEGAETLHPLCANCFEKREKFYLSYGPPEIEGLMRCGNCGSNFFPSEQKSKPASIRLLS